MRLGLEAGPNTLDIAVEDNVKGVPIGIDDLVNKGVDATLAPLRERGLEACQIGAFGFNPLSVDLEAQVKQTALLEKAIPMVRDTGCPYIVICGGNYHPSGYGAADSRNFIPGALDIVAEKLKPLLDLAEKHGAKISIEPYIKTAIYSPEQFLALWDKLKSDALCINVDVTNFYGLWELMDPTDITKHVCMSLAGHYGLVHLKEIVLAEGFHLNAGLAPLGTGNTDWAEILRLVEPHIPEDSWVVLEHVMTREEALASLKLLRQTAKQVKVTLE